MGCGDNLGKFLHAAKATASAGGGEPAEPKRVGEAWKALQESAKRPRKWREGETEIRDLAQVRPMGVRG